MDKAAFSTAWLKAHGTNEDKLQSALQSFFRGQAEEIADHLRSLKEKSADGIAASVFSPSQWDSKLIGVVSPFLVRAAATGAAFELNSIKTKASDDDLIDIPAPVLHRIQQFTDEIFAQDYWAGINRTTGRRLASVIADGLQDGQTLKEIADSIATALGTDEAADRSLMIARTEVTGATNAGHFSARESLADDGLITSQIWVAIEDGGTRETHSEADEQEVPVGKPFTVGGEECRFPGDFTLSPQERINCRCVAVSGGTFADG